MVKGPFPAVYCVLFRVFLYSETFLYSMDQPKADITKSVLYSDSLYFLHSRKKYYAHPLKDFYSFHDRVEASFLFLLQEDFYISDKYIRIFYLFSSSKGFWDLSRAFFETFSLLFDNILLKILYI